MMAVGPDRVSPVFMRSQLRYSGESRWILAGRFVSAPSGPERRASALGGGEMGGDGGGRLQLAGLTMRALSKRLRRVSGEGKWTLASESASSSPAGINRSGRNLLPLHPQRASTALHALTSAALFTCRACLAASLHGFQSQLWSRWEARMR